MNDGGISLPSPVEDPEERAALAALEEAQADLTASIRGLVDACVRTRVGAPAHAAVADRVRALTGELLEVSQDGPLGMEVDSSGRVRDHGNPMVGMRNPVAPPLTVTCDAKGDARALVELGAAYEGPPGCVHGGIIAAILDQVLGTIPARIGRPGMTAYLNTTYRRPTALGAQHTVTGWVERVEGWKVLTRGEIRDPEGRVTVEGEGLFVVPRWGREHLGAPTGDAGEFTHPDRPAS